MHVPKKTNMLMQLSGLSRIFIGSAILYQTLCYFDNPVGIIESPGIIFPVTPNIHTGLLVQHGQTAVSTISSRQRRFTSCTTRSQKSMLQGCADIP